MSHKIVLVTWKDAQDSDGTWTDIEDIINHELSTCQEVGWLIHKDREKIIVMRSRIVESDTDEIKEGGAYIAIPNTWVVSIQRLDIIDEI